jgi:hypothetical protein
VVVVVGSEESIQNLETYRRYLGQLADPRKLTEADAAAIVGKARPIYHLTAGLHSGETGPPEMLMELAYRLAVDESPLFRQIRANVIVTLTPNPNWDLMLAKPLRDWAYSKSIWSGFTKSGKAATASREWLQRKGL